MSERPVPDRKDRQKFRVVGIHRDGRREVRANHLSRDTAEAAHAGIVMAGEYHRVIIETVPVNRRAGRRTRGRKLSH